MLESVLRTIEIEWLESLSESLEVNISLKETLVMIIISFICGFFISVVYMKTSERGNYSKNFAITMILLPAIISSIILLIGSDIARAFSLAGAFSIIRFRSEPGEPKDIAYVLFSMGAGLALGIGEYLYAVIFTLILCVSMIILSKTNFANKKVMFKQLKITIPEDLNYEEAFKEVFDKFKVTYELKKVKTASLGSLYQLYYDVIFKDNIKTQAFIDELRIRNSNLDISLSLNQE
ncbi:DUF4956 domain-containing protein [Candidatus Izemoplasma sp. B36]|uniref:DUF4956 domain-containing protein n=1 Tax=Candidatus Izemoplasma sp. B36 TaxID=3242468 RepID=UPI00355781B7